MSQRANQTLYVVQGESWAHEFQYTDDNDVPQDLTGYTAKITFRDKIGGRVLKTISSPASGITISGSTGTIACAMSTTDTLLFTTTRAVWDLRLVSAGGNVIVPIGGDVEITLGVTQA